MSAKSRPPELLAPAGERAAAYAAFAFGADAIYTGLPRFSARAEAVNLSPQELEEIITYAHALPHPRRVYVTLNTLVREAEMPELVRSLALCAECGADAVIVQDFGIARLARKHFPSLHLHASTQMAIHNVEGVQAAARLGFRRVTLARELTLDEIRNIARQAPGEVETFLHGALCYSYSGLCLYSALLRNRSGNRGACAYPCRDSFCPSRAPGVAPARSGLVFSMKDLAGGHSTHELAQAGVASLKIEGRKKSPLYVAAAVNYHRKLLDRTFRPGEQDQCAHDLRTIFSRPWTSLYLQSPKHRDVIDPDATGHRGTPVGCVETARHDLIQFHTGLQLEVHDGLQFEIPSQTRPFGFAIEEIRLANDHRVFEAPAGALVQVPLPPGAPRIEPGTQLFLASSQAVQRRYRFEIPNPRNLRRRFPVDVNLDFSADRMEASASSMAEDDSFSATATMEGPFPAARNPAAMPAALRTAFSKLGDTPFELHELTHTTPAPFIPVSKLNQLRRDLSTALEQALRATRDQRTDDVIRSLHLQPAAVTQQSLQKPPPFLVKTDQPSSLLAAFPNGEFPRITELVIELGRESPEQIETALSRLTPHLNIRLALPMITRSWDRDKLAVPIRHFLNAGIRRWEASNLSALDFLTPTDELDLSADWPLYTLNSSALNELREHGFTRFTASPEDTVDNIAGLARHHPGQLVWIVHRDPPLFISESCPHAAQLGKCPGVKNCNFTEQTYTSKSGETVRTVNRHCRFFTLLEKPVIQSIPTGVPLIPRADFLVRTWTPAAIQKALKAGCIYDTAHKTSDRLGRDASPCPTPNARLR